MENIFKKNLLKKKLKIGLWFNLCSEITVDIIAGAGFDWILLDMELFANDIKRCVILKFK
jgi:2,4-dihydroxyhept-2-ene-1,7-dioic acid aldolase